MAVSAVAVGVCMDRVLTHFCFCCTGEVALKGLRVNQLELSRELAGTFQVSDKEVHIHAKVSIFLTQPQAYTVTRK